MKRTLKPKELFVERMKELLGEEYDEYWERLHQEPVRSIRVNRTKISPDKLKKRLKEKGWKVRQPFSKHPEIMIVEGKYVNSKTYDEIEEKLNPQIKLINKNKGGSERSELSGGNKRAKQDKNLIDLYPGELGRTLEHMLGYYYIQDISSMLPVIVLQPSPKETILDLAAAPGSKSTQIASEMENTGTLITNDLSIGRIKILSANLEKCGVKNTIITRESGAVLCKKLERQGMKFDKILLDAPCSGEGTIIENPKTLKMWSMNTVKRLSGLQKKLIKSAIKILKEGGEIVYSTCTHSPEENEEVIDYIIRNNLNLKTEKISLPQEFKSREGVTEWKDKEYDAEVKNCCRIYPHDNNTGGFFIAKLRKVK